MRLLQTGNRGTYSDSSSSAKHIGASGDGLTTLFGPTFPDASRLALHAVLAAKTAGITGVLGHLHLLDHLTESASITGSVFAYDASLLRVITHCYQYETRGR